MDAKRAMVPPPFLESLAPRWNVFRVRPANNDMRSVARLGGLLVDRKDPGWGAFDILFAVRPIHGPSGIGGSLREDNRRSKVLPSGPCIEPTILVV